MKNIAILVVALGTALGVTAPKPHKMCQIKGWLPGATATREAVTQKWNETPAGHPRGRDSYWIAWSVVDIRKVGDHRVNVPAEAWNDIDIGDQIEVVRLPGDRRPYLRNGIFVSAGNFAFDVILLAAEVGVALAMAIVLIRKRVRTADAR